MDTIIPFHIKILENSFFVDGEYNTNFLNNFNYNTNKEEGDAA